MSDEQLQESATSEPQTNAREQELLNRIEALDRKNKEILEESYNTLKGLPPLVTSWEIEKLKEKLSDVSAGKKWGSFLLTFIRERAE